MKKQMSRDTFWGYFGILMFLSVLFGLWWWAINALAAD